MTTNKVKVKKCNLIIWYLIIQLVAFSITFFIRNEITIQRYDNEPIVLATNVEVYSDKAVVRNCYLLTQDDCYQIAIYINDEWKNRGLHYRSIQSIESEIKLHKIAYLLRVRKEQSKDADIDLIEDSRFFVRVSYKTLEVIGS